MRIGLLVLALVTVPSVAHAQPAPATQPRAPSAAAPGLPPPPVVSDPMLAPVPPPKRILSSWPEAITFLRARSTHLKIALDQVLQAEALTRVALAQYMP